MERKQLLIQTKEAFNVTPIVALLGPRQSGKTTLARQFFEQYGKKNQKDQFFDLEDPIHLERLQNPKLAEYSDQLGH